MRWVLGMAVVVGMAGTLMPWLTGKVFDAAIPEADKSALYGFGVALVASAIATSLFKLTQDIATVRIQARMSSTIQASVWDRMLNLPVSFFRKFPAGDLADRAAGVEAIQELVAGAGVAAVLGSVSGTFYVFQMFAYNRWLAAAAIVLTIAFVAVNYGLNRWQLRSQRKEIQIRGRIAGLVLNLVTGVAKLRICGAEQHAFRVWAQQFASQRRISFSVGQIQNSGATVASFFPILSSMVLFYAVAQQRAAAVPGQPVLTTGQFIAFNAAFGLFLAATQALGDASLSLLRIVPIYERLVPILTQTPEVDRSKAYPGKLTGAIELSNLRFRYDSDGPFVINGVTLKIDPGELVAFVGPSGCGKSTLMRLMLGFETATSGSIYYDGQDLPALDIRAVRRQMGVVMQQSRVMPTEMYRNIVGVTTRTIEDAWEAAGKAGLADDIRNMPMGMHTYVSEGGGTLSGGQRQRLMIARAIVNRPKIIFLDEATSALDNRTQAIVTESMDQMSATRVVIAHRLSTIQNASRICYLQDGQIVEMGTYDELMAKSGMFAELARRQMA
jgi:NHLM bacteriocin system ABC transporter ATP-binding protein